ncbi:MAG TPA: peptide chain release factor N(5)-glutamine methyltransferase [Actinomycetota bacterium]|nr:peptide chain release factor N(5)-glutamine methyltransferase [Actinomycetota bacterium]
MNVLETDVLSLLNEARDGLRNAGIESAETEAEQMLLAASGLGRAELFGRAQQIPEKVAGAFLSMVERRLDREPLQYITGFAHFRRLDLQVGPGVLVPRPETEILVEAALGHISGIEEPVVADICTGSGAIAIAIATEHPGSTVYATDLSAEALRWARENVKALGVPDVRVLHSDLLQSLPSTLEQKFDLVAANPPYLDEETIAECPPEIRVHEPSLALFGGGDGAELSIRVARDAARWLKPDGWLVMETSPRLAARLSEVLETRFADVAVLPDLAGRERIVEGRLPSR